MALTVATAARLLMVRVKDFRYIAYSRSPGTNLSRHPGESRNSVRRRPNLQAHGNSNRWSSGFRLSPE